MNKLEDRPHRWPPEDTSGQERQYRRRECQGCHVLSVGVLWPSADTPTAGEVVPVSSSAIWAALDMRLVCTAPTSILRI
jgi:hypothetical protein